MFPRLLVALKRSDWMLTIPMLTLSAFGTAVIYALSLGSASNGQPMLEKQLIVVVIGFVCYVVVAVSPYRLFRGYALVLFAASLLLLLGVLIVGLTVRGTTGWFSFGFVRFQPVELAKLALVVILAKFCADRLRGPMRWGELWRSALIALLPILLTMFQPDFGSAMLLLSILAAVVLFAGLRWKFIVALAGFAMLVCLLVWQFGLATYQRDRVLTFLQPSRDPQGRGYNITQSLVAVGSGQWRGRGLGFGSQSQLRYLPESQTDFVFAVVAEELGFVGVAILLLSYGLLFWRIFWYARRSDDSFTSLLLFGIWAMLVSQTTINIGMNIGLLPVTGVSLPLVSYGGSSFVITCVALGMSQSAAIRFRSLANASSD